MRKVNIKPLSVNEAWQGRRFKTKAYREYTKVLITLLPSIEIPNPPFKIDLIFGFSNSLSDLDNPVKGVMDIMQKRYNFNDRDVYEMTIKKEIVKKGSEFIKFNIETTEILNTNK